MGILLYFCFLHTALADLVLPVSPSSVLIQMEPDPASPRCHEPVEITGSVSDSQKHPLPGVEVFFRSQSVAITASDGTYSFEVAGNPEEIRGQVIHYVKPSYVPGHSNAFSDDELTRKACAKIRIRREVMLIAPTP